MGKIKRERKTCEWGYLYAFIWIYVSVCPNVCKRKQRDDTCKLTICFVPPMSHNWIEHLKIYLLLRDNVGASCYVVTLVNFFFSTLDSKFVLHCDFQFICLFFSLSLSSYIYIYIYIYLFVCVFCWLVLSLNIPRWWHYTRHIAHSCEDQWPTTVYSEYSLFI